MGEQDTLTAGAEQLSTCDRIVPVPVVPSGERALWLGEMIHNQTLAA